MKRVGLILGATFAALSLHAAPVHACGGTFCDRGPRAMPVDQTGENILFVVAGGHVEAHIQIQYQGDPDKFAWVLPLPAVPTDIGVGSQVLFQNLLLATVPQVGSPFCPQLLNGGGGGGISVPEATTVEILLHQTVGAFDVTVLSGGTTAEVTEWLTTNGYDLAAGAPAILEDYVANGFVFAAVKLTSGTGTDEIHPIVVQYDDPGVGACVPLQLTAVAAVEDMGVRTFFLGNERVVPTNYASVELNNLRLDYLTGGANYQELVSNAVNEAGGRAFVTEYAGRSDVVQRAGIYSPLWNSAAFASAASDQVVDLLTAQGLASCADASSCTFSHPLVRPLLEGYLPAPAGVDPDAYYACLSCYAGSADAGSADGGVWDAAGFAADFDERIVQPGLHATTLLNFFPYLTRLFTTISPDEMTKDPLFTALSGLPDVSNQYLTQCGGGVAVTLQDANGTVVYLDDNGNWPAFDDAMPWASSAVLYAPDGTITTVVDNEAAIATALATWNDAHKREAPPIDSVPGFGAAGGAGSGTAGQSAVGGAPSSDAGVGAGAQPDGAGDVGGSGCACRAAPAPTRRSFGALALPLMGLAFARRFGRARRTGRRRRAS